MSKVFVITGPSGVGKGTLITRLLERVPDLELSVSATTREPREGEVDGRDYHFLTPEEFDRRIEAEDFLEFATYSGNRYGTLRSEVGAPASARATRSCSRSRCRARARCGRRCASRSRSSSRRPTRPPAAAAGVTRHRPAEAIDARLEVAEQELAAQDEFAHRVVNDDLDRAADELEADRARRARHTSRLPGRMIKPRVDKLLDHADSHYAAVVVAGQAGPADQQLLPQPRRGQLRRVPAADGRGPARAELPLDGARGACRGQAQIRVPLLVASAGATGRRRKPMARILLGVSGGIAAYKSLELARLATARRPRRARR